MIDINKEAEEYANQKWHSLGVVNSLIKQGVIAGHNSKATQAKVLQSQIDILTEHRNSETIYWLDSSIKLLQQQLEQLENGN
jgi:hypothetical protein